MSITAGYSPRVAAISMYLAGNEDILDSQLVKVTSHESFSNGDRPIPGGLFDPRMTLLVRKSIMPTTSVLCSWENICGHGLIPRC